MITPKFNNILMVKTKWNDHYDVGIWEFNSNKLKVSVIKEFNKDKYRYSIYYNEVCIHQIMNTGYIIYNNSAQEAADAAFEFIKELRNTLIACE